LTTAVDSSVRLDVFGGDSRFGPASREALRAAYDIGALVACDVVWAEVRAHFDDDGAFERAVGLLGVRFDAISDETALASGRLWQKSRGRAHGPRTRLVADFLIGAHAVAQADALLSRDRGFYRRYFRIELIDPSVS
jgi:hypothetical protein